MTNDVVKQHYKITRSSRREINSHNSFLVFFTGLSGSGKSTIANALEQKLYEKGIRTYVLDGDNIRRGINQDLGFSPEDRSENNRRIGHISNLFIDAGIVVLAAFVAPYNKDRDTIKQTVGENNYVEVFINTSLDECEKRDVKGLYKKARSGQILNMTGISAPYEKPKHFDVEVSERHSINESVSLIYDKIKGKLKL